MFSSFRLFGRSLMNSTTVRAQLLTPPQQNISNNNLVEPSQVVNTTKLLSKEITNARCAVSYNEAKLNEARQAFWQATQDLKKASQKLSERQESLWKSKERLQAAEENFLEIPDSPYRPGSSW